MEIPEEKIREAFDKMLEAAPPYSMDNSDDALYDLFRKAVNELFE